MSAVVNSDEERFYVTVIYEICKCDKFMILSIS